MNFGTGFAIGGAALSSPSCPDETCGIILAGIYGVTIVAGLGFLVFLMVQK